MELLGNRIDIVIEDKSNCVKLPAIGSKAISSV